LHTVALQEFTRWRRNFLCMRLVVMKTIQKYSYKRKKLVFNNVSDILPLLWILRCYLFVVAHKVELPLSVSKYMP
jgi:hypothetical protein